MGQPSAAASREVAARLELALSAGRDAGNLTLQYFQRDNYQVERKSDASPVTIADRSAEQLLRQRIGAAFPADGIIGEEFGTTKGTSGFNWILDPIDGTKSFISGVPLYGTMVGVEHGGRCLAGLIYMPALSEGVYAATGKGTWHWHGEQPPRQVRVSRKDRLAEGLLCTSELEGYAVRQAESALAALVKAAWISRTWGDCYGYLLVATGRAEVMVDPLMKVWDSAAVQPIVEEAGGSLTDWQGQPTIHAGEAIATNGLVLEEVLAITRQYPRPSS